MERDIEPSHAAAEAFLSQFEEELALITKAFKKGNHFIPSTFFFILIIIEVHWWAKL